MRTGLLPDHVGQALEQPRAEPMLRRGPGFRVDGAGHW